MIDQKIKVIFQDHRPQNMSMLEKIGKIRKESGTTYEKIMKIKKEVLDPAARTIQEEMPRQEGEGAAKKEPRCQFCIPPVGPHCQCRPQQVAAISSRCVEFRRER